MSKRLDSNSKKKNVFLKNICVSRSKPRYFSVLFTYSPVARDGSCFYDTVTFRSKFKNPFGIEPLQVPRGPT